jgi:hypothetical protein
VSLLAGNDAILAEAVELIAKATKMGLTLRLLGGIAICATCPSSVKPPFARVCEDVDFIGEGNVDKLSGVFASRGWKGDREFNLYNGESRLIFHSGDGQIKADVFIGSFRMCHGIPLSGRMHQDALSLPLAELLLTKLQVVQANGKDLADAACILLDHSVDDGDGDHINALLFARACAADWGLWKTVGMSLSRLRAWIEAKDGMNGAERNLVLRRISELEAAMESEPKNLKWKARSAIGDRLRWYELPEEIDR